MASLPRSRRSILGFFGSILTHAAIVLAILFLFRRGGDGDGGGGSTGGEDGHAGAGDTALDVSLASPAATEIAAPEEVVTPPQTPVAPHEPEQTDPDGFSEPVAIPPPKKVLPPLPHSDVSATGQDETTNGGKRPLPTRIPSPGSGGGSGGGNGAGVGAGNGDSIEGQRALLPKAAVCTDPITGRWEALKYNPLRSDWVHFMLTVHREGAVVSGTILSHTWSGGPRDSAPPACEPGGYDLTVSMNARGGTSGERITFGASHFSIVFSKCPMTVVDYVPDQFSGTIDPGRQEFQSLNNDGVVDINQPYVFRRTGCVDQ
ncbi:MAG: hypothetical protein ABI461_15655 [Polyangiaceae bacterium]